MTTATDSRIEACNQVIDHLMECLELAAGCGMGYSSIRAALDVANTHRVRVQNELDESEEEPHAGPGQFCPTCGGVHCSNPAGHKWNDDSYCIRCGTDGTV